MKAKIFVYAPPALVLTTIHLAQAQQGGVYHVGVPSLGESSSLQGCRAGAVSDDRPYRD
jgi:hypothetical protein